LAGVLATGLMAKPPHKGGKHEYKYGKHYKKGHNKDLHLKGDNANAKAYTQADKENLT